MTEYGLARHVFICRDEEQIVVLDLRADRYRALLAARPLDCQRAFRGGPGPRRWPGRAPRSQSIRPTARSSC